MSAVEEGKVMGVGVKLTMKNTWHNSPVPPKMPAEGWLLCVCCFVCCCFAFQVVDCCVLFVYTTATITKRRWDAKKQKREDNNSSLHCLPRLLTSPQQIAFIFHLPLVVDVFEGTDGFGGLSVVSVGHFEACHRPMQMKEREGESIKKLPARWFSRQFLTSIFRLPLVDDVCEGIRRSDGVGGWCGVIGKRWQVRRWEIKIFVSTSKHHLKIIDAINISPSFFARH
jgi:hypothetical protein